MQPPIGVKGEGHKPLMQSAAIVGGGIEIACQHMDSVKKLPEYYFKEERS